MSVVTQMEPAGHDLRSGDIADRTLASLLIFDTAVDAGARFELHVHREDQLVWMARGSCEVDVPGERWSVDGGHVVWIPAGVAHEMDFGEPGRLLSLYVAPDRRPEGERWGEAHVLRHDPLIGAILQHLASGAATPERRRRCWSLLRDVLGESRRDEMSVTLPRDPRVRAVVAALVADPADRRELADWAAVAGVSTKTVARAFVAETGVGFREWRMRLRMRAAAARLTRGEPVASVADAVGYDTVSGFIAVFRDRNGVTPAVFASRRASERLD